jgi:hypothetical protein
MDPFFAAAFAISGFVNQNTSSNNQYKLEKANLDAQLANIKLQSQESALELTKELRQNVATNTALFARGGRSDTALTNLNSSSLSAYYGDQAKIQRGLKLDELRVGELKSYSKANKSFAKNKSLVDNLKYANDAGLFSASTWKR